MQRADRQSFGRPKRQVVNVTYVREAQDGCSDQSARSAAQRHTLAAELHTRDWAGRSTYLARTVCGSIAPTAKTTVRRLVPSQPIDWGERL